jgi:class 3 adenylate cyclase/tetratricopeptide (TPR) repeat protein
MVLTACPTCGTDNEPGARFCKHCGTRLGPAPCSVCGTVNPADARFCMNCGNNLLGADGPAPGASGASPAPTAERRLVSVLFVDLVGFTTASERRDAEDTRDLLTRYYDTAREIVARYGGTIEKFIGDAVMAVWGSPTAHEDDAERAVRAGLELVAAVPRLEGAGDLQARGGVLTGEAAVSIGLEGQGMIAGDMVNTASRLQSAASAGTVLVGEATYRAANQAIAFEAGGERELKGKGEPVAVWEATSVVARRGGEGRAATLEPPFVGRDDELQLLKELFHTTVREGKPRLVTLTGIAGIGKSRLLWELEKYLDGVVDQVYLLSGRSPSYGDGVSYWALAEMLRGRAGITESEDPGMSRDRVRQMLERFVADETERRWIEPRVLGVLGLDQLPAETRDELFAALRMFLERIAADSTLVLGFWDLQWADQGMLDFVEHVLTWARTSPILVLAEARPELFDRRPDWGRSIRSATLMHLDPLGPEHMRELLLGLVPGLPDEPLGRIVGRAEGVPLYAVETLRMLLDKGILEARDGHLQLTGPLPVLAVPETLHALIASRLDGLPPDERGILTDGSVLGLSFSRPALVAVSGLAEDAVERLTESLIRRELLTIEADPRSPERGQYRFLQGVVREITYQSIAKKNRQAKHVAAARYFEALGEDDLAGVLATHYLAAYGAAAPGPEADALAAQARVALRAAAERASALHDLLGAHSALEQALLVTPDVAEQAALHERAITIAGNAARFEQGLEHAERAVELYRQLGDRPGEIRARALQASVHHMEHQEQLAIAALRTLLADATDLPPSPEIAQAQAELGRALMLAGSTMESIEWCDRVLANPAAATPAVLLEAVITKGTALTMAGHIVEAEALLRGAVAIADNRGFLDAGLRSRNNLRVLLMYVDLRDALGLNLEVRDIARKFGDRSWILQSIGGAREIGFRLGDWDAFEEDVANEVGEAGDYYANWFRMEAALRESYRGDASQAQAAIERSLASGLIDNSGQAITWNLAAKADAQIARGMFAEAIESAQNGLGKSSENDLVIVAMLFAAAGLGDAARVLSTTDLLRDNGFDQLPAGRAYIAVAHSLAAALQGRWDEARDRQREAIDLLDAIGEGLTKARFGLALGHLASGRFPEADGAAAEAERWFADRGAAHYVAAYRAAAATAGAGVPDAAVGTAARPASSASVRAGG